MIKLNTERISLRAAEPVDLENLFGWENDIENWEVSGTITPFSKNILEQYLKDAHLDIYTTKQLRLMIDQKTEINGASKCIGCIDLFEFDPKNKRAGIGILIADKKYRGKGIAGEALGLVIDYAFSILDLHTIFANIGSTNEASISLFKKAGFKEQGIKKDWNLNLGIWSDEYFFQLFRTY